MKATKTIFLAGPIRGIPRKDSLGWRDAAKNLLGSQFTVLHALRGREERETIPDPRLVIIRDKRDINNSDIVLVNDTHAEASMIGTAMEVLYAHERGKVIVVFGCAHPSDYWLNNHSHVRCDTLESACKLIKEHF